MQARVVLRRAGPDHGKACGVRAICNRVLLIALLAVFAATIAWVVNAYRRDIDRAHARLATGSQLVTTPCGVIEYAERGSGPAVLSVHGAGGGFDQGLLLGAPLLSKGYRIIAMSRFGYLRTPAPAHVTLALQADAHACLLDALGVKTVAVIGVSAGAPSSLEFALRYPERCRALVLLVPGWYPDPQRLPRPPPGYFAAWAFGEALRSDFLFWAIRKLGLPFVERTVLGTPPEVIASASTSEQARVATILREIEPVSERRVGLSLEAQLTIAPLSKPLAALSTRTLAISVEDDLYRTYDNARVIAAGVPDGHFIGFASGGHLWVGHNDEVFRAVGDFLEQKVSVAN